MPEPITYHDRRLARRRRNPIFRFWFWRESRTSGGSAGGFVHHGSGSNDSTIRSAELSPQRACAPMPEPSSYRAWIATYPDRRTKSCLFTDQDAAQRFRAEWPAWTVTEVVPAEQLEGAVEEAYYRGVADAMDALRAHDFPFTERVDHIAAKLAPTRRQ